MQDWDDQTLLRDYVGHGSEAAFAELVTRHVNKVYSVALRHTGNPHSAEEITQAVFVVLARKSGNLGRSVILSGWLYHTARLTAITYIRGEIRRARREQEAHMQTTIDKSGEATWPRIAPLLDTAMAGLSEADRTAVVLRFFDGKSMKEVGATLGASEITARKRVNRAVEKLRRFFTKRGVLLPAAALTAAISANSVQAAPAALAGSATTLALTKGAAASGSTLTLIKGALKLMAWTKAKMAVAVGVGILLATGSTVVTVKVVYDHNYPWQVEVPTADMLEKCPAIVKIVPTKFPNKPTADQATLGQSSLGIGVHVQDLLWAAYDPGRYTPGHKSPRMLLLTRLTPAKYDYIANLPLTGMDKLRNLDNPEALQQEIDKLPSWNAEALQRELKKQLGLVARRETIVTNVLLLKVRYPDAPGLLPVTTENQVTPNQKAGEISFQDQGCKSLAGALGADFGMPVLDETSLTNRYYYDLKWNAARNRSQSQLNLKKALLDQLGLDLVPDQRPVEMLVVEKAQ